MKPLVNYLNSIFKKPKEYRVVIDDYGAFTVENMLEYLISPEGQEQLKKTKDFYEKCKGVPLKD